MFTTIFDVYIAETEISYSIRDEFFLEISGFFLVCLMLCMHFKPFVLVWEIFPLMIISRVII